MRKPTLVIMAAGVGRRYGGLKQVDGIGPHGEPALAYAVYDALRAGFARIVFVVRESIRDAFRDAVARDIEKRVETAYVCQELDGLPDGFTVPEGREKPWGTGHAVLCCRDAVDSPFAVVNADDFYGRSSYVLLARDLNRASNPKFHPPEAGKIRNPQLPHDFCLVGFSLKNTLSPHGHVARGICEVGGDLFLQRVVERTRIQEADGRIVDEDDGGAVVELAPDSIASMNIWGFTPDVFPHLHDQFIAFLQARGSDPTSEFYLPEAVGGMAGDGIARVRVLKTDEKWFGITYREDKPRVQKAIRELVDRGVYPERLWD